MTRVDSVIVVGGGWSGLAAAAALADSGRPIVLLESARQLGGRARSAPAGDWAVDNGQHLLIGAYRATLGLLNHLGVEEKTVLSRQPLRWHMLGRQRPVDLRAPLLPAPLHLAVAIATARGLASSERRSALAMALRLYLTRFRLSRDTSVAELLTAHRQPQRVIDVLWEPLCLATLNTPPAYASARVFLRVLRDAFARRRSDADLLVPRLPLGELLPTAAARYLSDRNHRIETSSRVERLTVGEGGVNGVRLHNGELLQGDVVVATSPWAAARLLETVPGYEDLYRDLLAYRYQPIATIYLQYPSAVYLDPPMMGMSGTLSQWLFDRRLAGQEGLVSVVISAEGPHMAMKTGDLIKRIESELAEQFPDWPAAERGWVIREKRATFHCDVAVQARRPDAGRLGPGLWLAGDYTANGYPATLEGAVRSGLQCALQIEPAIDPSLSNY